MMKKKPVANSNKVSVTFELPPDVSSDTVYVVGDFNNWDTASTPMKRLKDGTWSTTVRLAPGTYRFRYYGADGSWYNDESADGSEPSGYGSDNSVIKINGH
jgi:1,4-alpha-glucan branching enzyme